MPYTAYIFEPFYRLLYPHIHIDNPTQHSSTMVHNYQEQEATPQGKGYIPVLVCPMTLSHPGIWSGGLPPKPTVEAELIVEAEPQQKVR